MVVSFKGITRCCIQGLNNSVQFKYVKVEDTVDKLPALNGASIADGGEIVTILPQVWHV